MPSVREALKKLQAKAKPDQVEGMVRYGMASIETAKRIRRVDSKAARWVASGAIRELESENVQRRLGKGI